MKIKSYKDLIVWHYSIDLVVEVYDEVIRMLNKMIEKATNS